MAMVFLDTDPGKRAKRLAYTPRCAGFLLLLSPFLTSPLFAVAHLISFPLPISLSQRRSTFPNVFNVSVAPPQKKMFGRRVASSCRIPANMYTRLGISSPQQANRMLPALVSVNTLVARSVSGGASTFASLTAGAEAVPSELAAPANLVSLLGMTPQALLGVVNASPLLLRMISDTMCTYSALPPQTSS